MNIYYGASIRGENGDSAFNREIINHLKKYGKVLSEHLFSEHYVQNETLSDRQIHDRDESWIIQSDRLVMEVSSASLEVGYEIRTGLDNLKQILCLFKPQPGKKLSAMISGAPALTIHPYSNLSDAKLGIDLFMSVKD